MREQYSTLSTYQLAVKDGDSRKSLRKNDLLMIVKVLEFPTVKTCALCRPDGLTVSCKMIAQVPWRIIGWCKVGESKNQIAFFLIFKHAIWRVEKDTTE